jgi:hypothetical protein
MTALVGALLVALIASVTADRRLTKQLAAEHQRHAAELAHDRELTDLGDLRSLFDEAALALRDTERAYGHAAPAVGQGPIDEQLRCQRVLDVLAARLHVRLGTTDEITTTFADAHSAARRLAAATTSISGPGVDGGAPARLALTLALDDFLSASALRAGARSSLDPARSSQRTG